jgi:hypothetical protein
MMEMMVNMILVQISNKQWTMQAMHLASAMARNTHTSVTLLHLMRVRSPALLGTELGVLPPTTQEHQDLREYEMIAEDYGVEVILQPMQYDDAAEAIVQAAEYTDASVVFAHMPESMFPFWKKFQTWNLRRELLAQGRQIYFLDQNENMDEWVPSVSLKAAKQSRF